jgi:hypothetical protein
VQWEPSLVDAALAGATVILAFFLVAMVRLAILDWLTERQSGRAWSAIGTGAEEVATAPVVEEPEHPYAPALPDPAVSAILRAHRHAVPLSPTKAVPDAGNAAPGVGALQDVPQGALLPGTSFVVASTHAGGLDDAVAALSNGVGDHGENRREARKVFHSVAPATAAIGCKLRRQFSSHLATQVRLVANAGWSGSALRVLAVPVKIISDIVTTGQGEKEPPCGKTSPDPLLNGRTPGPFTERVAGHAAPARTGRHRDLAKSLDPAAVAEARRQIVALAEALARQAAREDDAAENAREGSRSPQDLPAEELPSPVAKDDTD